MTSIFMAESQELSDTEYATIVRRTFSQVKVRDIRDARGTGRVWARVEKRLTGQFNGETWAQFYRWQHWQTLDSDVASLLEAIFLISYTNEFYKEQGEQVDDDDETRRENQAGNRENATL